MKALHSLASAACLACLAFTAHGGDESLRATLGTGAYEADMTSAQTLLVTGSPAASTTQLVANQPAFTPGDAAKSQARYSAFADGASTMLGLANGLVETNPIMPVSPIGILLVTAGKMGIASWADTLPEAQRADTLRSMSATFGGAAVNNLLTLVAGATPLGLIGGVIAGVYFWNDTNDKLQAEAEAKRAFYMAKAQEHHRNVMLAYNANTQTQGVSTRLLAGNDLGTLDGNPATDLRAAVLGKSAAPAKSVQVAQNFTVLPSKGATAPTPAPMFHTAPTAAPVFTPVLDSAPLEAWPSDDSQTVPLARPLS